MIVPKFAVGLRDRRALAIGAVLVGLAIVVRLAFPALDALRAAAERNQVRADARARAARRPGAAFLAETLARVTRSLDSARSELLPAGSGAAVASHLHATVRGAATDVGLAVLSSRAEADSASEGRFIAVTVRIDAEGDVSNVMQFLLLLELARGSPRLTEVSISPLEPAARDERAETIRLSMTIEGIAPRHDIGTVRAFR